MGARFDKSGLMSVCNKFQSDDFNVKRDVPLPGDQRYKVPILLTSPNKEFLFPVIFRQNPVSINDETLLEQCGRVAEAYQKSNSNSIQVLVVAPLIPGGDYMLREFNRGQLSELHTLDSYIGNTRKF